MSYWSGRTGRGRPICWKRFRSWRPGAACVAWPSRKSRPSAARATGPWRRRPSETPDGPGRHRHRRGQVAGRAAPRSHQWRQRPHRRGNERLSPRAVADPGDGWAVHRSGRRAPPLPRPAGHDAGPGACCRSQRPRQIHAPPQSPAGGRSRSAVDLRSRAGDGGGSRRRPFRPRRQPRAPAASHRRKPRGREFSRRAPDADAAVPGWPRAGLLDSARGGTARPVGGLHGRSTAPPAARWSGRIASISASRTPRRTCRRRWARLASRRRC